MGWKSVALAACLLPVLTGCGAVRRAAENLNTDVRLAHTQRAIERDLRKEAHAAWATVRGQHPDRPFTYEFHDGFLDGFVDYLDRGGNAQPPAVPPIKYVRDKKYFTPEGHCLINDYYLGFKYGADVAVASGKRQYLTVPVLLPDGSCPPAAIYGPGTPAVPYVPPRKPGSDELPPPRPLPDPKKKSDDPILPVPPDPKLPDPRPLPTPPDPKKPNGVGRTIPPLPMPEVPVIKPFNIDLPGGKFAPLPVPRDPDLLPAPNPPLPIPSLTPLPLPVPPDEPRSGLPPVLEPTFRVPALKLTLPPDILPAAGVTPPILEPVPVIPFRHESPTPGVK